MNTQENNRTREDWLKEAALLINEHILKQHEAELPENWSISCGFPSGSAKAIGQAWDKEACSDEKTYQMFISPVLGKHDIVNLMQVILHESIHLAAGIDQKHGGKFKRLARAIGLEGRLTATYVSHDSPLATRLEELANKVGFEYPHEILVQKAKPKKERTSNIVTLVSPEMPSYTIKVKRAIIEQFGYPKDPLGNEMFDPENSPEDGEEE